MIPPVSKRVFMSHLLFLPSIGCTILSTIIAFLWFTIRRLQKENEDILKAHSSLQENWMQECERRAIAEERASYLVETEKSLKHKEDLIAQLLIEQSEIKSRLAEKEVLLAQQTRYEQERFLFLQEAQQ